MFADVITLPQPRPLSWSEYMDNELVSAFWHLSNAQRGLDELAQDARHAVLFRSGKAKPLLQSWELNLKALDVMMQQVIQEMTRRHMAIPSFAKGATASS